MLVKQITLFLALVFVITWGVAFWVATQPPPSSLGQVLWAFLPQVWAPTIVAVALVVATEGVQRLRKELGDRLRYNSGTLHWLAFATIVPAALTCVAVFAARAAGDGAAFTPSTAIPMAIGMQVITGAVGEELGWRGFLLPRLGKRIGVVAAAWVMGLLWSLWHIPAWFIAWLPHSTLTMPATVASLAFTAAFGVFLAFVFNRAGESVLATILAHLSLNITTAMGGVQLSSFAFWFTLAAIFGILSIFESIALSRSSDTTLLREARRKTDLPASIPE